MRFVYLLLLTISFNTIYAQDDYYQNVKNISFFQNDILLNEEIVFQTYTIDKESYEVLHLDGKTFIKAKIIGGNTLYFFQDVNLYFQNAKFNDLKDLFKYITYYNVFDENLSVDKVKLVKFLSEYNQF